VPGVGGTRLRRRNEGGHPTIVNGTPSPHAAPARAAPARVPHRRGGRQASSDGHLAGRLEGRAARRCRPARAPAARRRSRPVSADVARPAAVRARSPARPAAPGSRSTASSTTWTWTWTMTRPSIAPSPLAPPAARRAWSGRPRRTAVLYALPRIPDACFGRTSPRGVVSRVSRQPAHAPPEVDRSVHQGGADPPASRGPGLLAPESAAGCTPRLTGGRRRSGLFGCPPSSSGR
jgi:hypothetical protein